MTPTSPCRLVCWCLCCLAFILENLMLTDFYVIVIMKGDSLSFNFWCHCPCIKETVIKLLEGILAFENFLFVVFLFFIRGVFYNMSGKIHCLSIIKFFLNGIVFRVAYFYCVPYGTNLEFELGLLCKISQCTVLSNWTRMCKYLHAVPVHCKQ